jgi:glycine oxidase
VNQIDIAVVGGGIIGLSAAIELAEAGRQVTVFERSEPMREASWAAAGMIAGNDPENPATLQPLSDLSVALYPKFLATIERLSGMRVPIRTTKTIQGGHGVPAGRRPLDTSELPALAPDFRGDTSLDFFLMEENSLDPRDLVRALPVAARAAGVTILEDQEITSVDRGNDAAGITTREDKFSANTILCCVGAWMQELTGIPVFPRKGQLALVQEPVERLRCVLRTPEVYLVPRGGGRVVIGATVEDAGFDKSNDQHLDHLLEKAAALWPAVRESRIVESWAGLRPASPDRLPLIDRCGSRCFVAAGHYRNGIMLAPGTARVIRQLIQGEVVAIDLDPYSCGRFAASSVHSECGQTD